MKHRTRAALLASLAALLQVSAGLIPGPGHVLSALGTLPIAILAASSPPVGLTCLLAASGAVFLLQPLEAPVLLFTTGSLGLALGWGIQRGHSLAKQAAEGGAALTLGMLALTYAAGMPALGSLTRSWSIARILGLFIPFALAYSLVWALLLRWLLPRLTRSARHAA